MVYRKDGTPIPVVTIENDRGLKPPLSVSVENKVEQDRVVQSKPLSFGPLTIKSEPDR